MARGGNSNTHKSLLLISLMILMTQVGYLDNLNPWTTGEETLDETDDVMETGGSSFVYANNKIATGYSTTCAILDNGSLTCWGYDGDGQLGNGATLTADQHAPPATFIDLGQGRTAVAVDFTYDHGCAILNDGSVMCWGSDNFGQLGDGGALPVASSTHTPSPVSVDLGIGRTAVSIATGYYHSCAVLDNGSIVCWGADDQGQLGNGGLSTSDQSSPSTAVDLGVGRTAVTVTAGRDHVCALLDDGSVKCWGDDLEGQLGAGLNGNTNYNGFGYDSDVPTPVLLPTGRTAIAVEANYRHTCAILDDGSLTCWGSDWRGELGNGGTNTALDYPSTNPIDLGTGRTAVAVSLGRAHTCAILDNGDAKCWGWDSNGQLGDGGVSTYDGWRHTTSPSSTSIDLGTGRTAVAISAGGFHTCAILDNGTMLCWGEDSSGQLGNGATTGSQGSPVSVAGSYTWDTTTTVSSGSGSTANTLSSSAEGANLIVGIPMTDITFGTTTASSSSLALGYNHACSILDNGSVKCWGVYTHGRLGNFATQNIGDGLGEMGDALVVTNLGTGRTATSISAGLHSASPHTCAVLDDGTVKCWGFNNNGQLGIGNTTTMGDTAERMGDNLSAVDLGTGRTAVDVSVGNGFSCALLDNGSVKCWGRNAYGQLGIGNTTTMGDAADEMGDNLSAVDLGTGRTAVAIATGYDHVCAILDNGQVKCWGANTHGRLGIGSTTTIGDAASEMGDNLAYTSLGTGLTPVQIDAGNGHTCALFDNGSVKCWGFNQYGNLGLGNTTHQGDGPNEMGDDLSFVDLGTGRTAVDLSALTQAVCAVLDNGDVKCWGRNHHGQLGIGNTVQIGDGPNEMGDNLVATNLGTGVKALAVRAGFSHNCAIIDNGSLKCWGSNGDGTTGGWLGIESGITKGNDPNEMGDNLPFVNLGTGASMQISQFTSCSSSPNLPPGLSMNNCVISGTPTAASTNQTYTISAVLDGVTYQASIYLSASYLELTPSAEGADLSVGVPMDDITFQFNTSATINRTMQNGVPVGILSGCGYELISHVMDSNDHHHLTHYDGCYRGGTTPSGIHYSTNSGGSWTTTLIDSGPYGMGYANAIAVDSNDNPHIVYGIDNLYYTTLSNGVWSSPIVLDQTVGREISMIIDSSDNIHISSNKFITGGDLNYTSYVSGTWSTETVASASSLYPGPTAIAVDSAGDVYIAMIQEATSSGANTNYLSVYNNSGGSWSSDFIDSGALGDYSVDLAIDSNDVTHLYYRKGGQHVIKNDASGSWSSDLYTLTGSTWDSMGDMVVESDGTVHIVAKHGTNSAQFQYATNKSGSWVNQAIANSSGFVHPTYNALALNSQGDMHYFFRAGSSGQTGVLYHLVESGASTVGSGSNAGTSNGNGTAWMVKDIRSGSSSSSLEYLTAVGNTLYFSANDGTNGHELWKTDGTASGTVMVKDINSGSGNSNPHSLTAVGNTLYFEADDGTNGSELWKSDGTASGTVMVKDIRSGSSSSSNTGNLNSLTAVGSTLYFTANDGTNGKELWKSDGTASGTVMVKDIRSGSGTSGPLHLTAVGNTLYFEASDGTNGYELWKSDGTASGTVMVKDINSGSSSSSNTGNLNSFTAVGSTLYFEATDGTNGYELWKSDGTASGTVMVKDINSGSNSGGINSFTAVGSTLYFTANDGTNGVELWKSDGTASGTVMVKDINSGSGTSDPDNLAAVGNTLYFEATDVSGTELWKSDGTASGTVMVKDIRSGSGDSSPSYLTAVGNTLYFRATDGTNGYELWKSDGTASGTVMVKDINSGGGTSGPLHLTAVGNTLYFEASDGTNGKELWTVSGGSGSGSGSGGGSGSGSGSGSSSGMTNVNSAMSCVATPSLPAGLNIDSSTCTISGTPTAEAVNATYEINATISGITYLASIWLSSAYSELIPSYEGADLYLDVPMTDITFHYNASTATTTAVGTVDGQITTYGNGSVWNAELPGSYCCYNSNFLWNGHMSILVGDTIYFDGDDSGQQSVGRELFAFNTSNETTWLVKDINPNFDSGGYQTGSDSQVGRYLHVLIGDTIYFDANDGSTGHELWAHNTTNQTTWQVADINDGAGSSNPGSAILHVIDDTLYFTAKADVSSSAELWAYNTSNLTAWNVTDIDTRNGGSIGQKMSMLVGDTIYFDANMGYLTLGGMFAYNTSNHTWWRAVSFTKDPGYVGNGNTMEGYMSTLIGDTIYFDALNETNKHEVFAHNTLNGTTWQVSSFNYSPNSGTATVPGRGMEFVVGDTLYFEAQTSIGSELWAYTTTNRTIWLVDEINPDFQSNSPLGSSPGQYMTILVGDVLYFDAYGPDGDDSQQYPDGRELWALSTSNHTTWQVADLYQSSGSNSDGNPGEYMAYLVGDTIYFSAMVYGYYAIGGAYGQYGVELVAHDTSNGSTWLVEDIRTGTYGSSPGMPYNQFFVNDTLYFAAHPTNGNSRWYAHQPAEIASSGSSGTCSISPGLPTGLNIDSSTCTISGTPTVESVNQTYTVTAVISGVTYQGSVWLSASTFGTITSAVEGAALNLGEAMTPITLNYTSQAGTATVANGSGNETRWTIAEEVSSGSPYHVVEACNSGSQQQTIGIETMLPDWLEYGSCSGLIEDTIYFRGRSNASSASVPYSLWAFRPANDSVWAVTPHLTFATTTYIQIVDERIYFIAMPQSNYIAGSTDLYVHDTTNGSTWMAYDVANNVAEWSVFGDHLLLHEWGGSSGNLLNLHTFSTNETWEVPGKWVHQSNPAGYKSEYGQFHKAGNQILFQSEGYYIDSNINNGNALETGSELWVYDLSNNTTFGFDVSPITSSFASEKSTHPHFFHTIGTRTYFRACETGTTHSNGNACGLSASSIKTALWVYESSNTSIWRVTPTGEQMQGHWVGDQFWDLKANPDNSNLIGLRIFDSTNHSIWWETNGISLPSNNNNYYNTAHVNYPFVHVWAGTRAYFTAKTSGNLHNSYYQTHLWAYEASNNSAWELLDGANVPGTSGNPSNFCNSQTGTKEHVIIGTEIFFLTYHNDACGGWLSMEPYGEVTFSIPPPTTWETHPALPAGMSISAGTISGTPSVYAKNQTYTIYANQSGYSTTHELYFSVDTDNAHTVVENQAIDPIGFHPPFDNGTTCWTVSPGLPGNLSIDSSTGEITGSVNGTLTNSTYTVTANHNCSGGSSGNGTTWIPTPSVGIDPYAPRMADYFMLEHDDVIYFDAVMSNGIRAVNAFSTVNGTMWNTYDLSSITSATSFQPYPGNQLAQFVGDDLFFTIKNSTSGSIYELWVYSTSNGTTWRAMQQTASSYGLAMEFVIGDRLYFDELAWNGGSSFSSFIGVYDTSNHSYWNYSTTMLNYGMGSCPLPGANFHAVVGDTIYFDACDASQSYGVEMYAFNTVNESYWRVADLDNGTDHSWPGKHMHIVIDDVIYFDAQVGTGAINTHALYAYNTSNGTIWLAADLKEPGYHMKPHSQASAIQWRKPVVIGDTMYFDAWASSYTARTSIGYTCTGQEIYAYNIGNQTAWCVADAGGSGWSGTGHMSDAGQNMLSLVGDVLLFDAETGSTQGGTSSRTYSLWAHNLSNGSTWEISTVSTYPDILTNVGSGFSAFSTNNALYFPARNTTVGLEIWGYDIVNQTYWLAHDTCPGVYNGVSGGNFHTLVHQGVFYSSVRISQNGQGEQYILGVFNPVPSSSTSSGGSGSGSGSGSSTGTSTTETFTFNLQSLADYDGDGLPNDLPSDYDAAEGPTPGLVADTDDDADGLLDTVETNTGTYVDSSNTGTDPLNPDTDGDGICDGPLAVPGVCVAGPDTNNGATVVDTPIVLLNNSDVDEIAPFYPVTGATYGLSPDLPTSMQFDSSNGSIWGTPDMVMTNTTYTMWANLTDGTSTSWTFFLEVLEDLDGDGMPDVLPGDYDAVNDPIRTPGLEEDLDDDGDGYNDTAETDTGLYLDGNNTGTDPRDPDTDDDGICDGPGTVAGVCTAGPDLTPFGPPATVVAVNNTMIPSVPPYYAGSGLTYEVSPDLPNGLTIDPNNGYLMGIPTETTGNITYTVYANDTNGNTYSWDFTIEVLEDSDGDGSPDSLPSDYDGEDDSIRPPPGLTEDLDDDNDGMSDEDEITNGTEPLNPDTDGDGFCDGINAVAGVCFAGPDPYPNDANLPLDTDGDGLPDDDSDWTGPPYADDDDDNDGFPDASEEACGSDSLDANSIPADMDGDTICDGDDLDMDGDGIDNVNETGETGVPPGTSPTNPDTDGDGICDGPTSPITSNCTAGPDAFPLDPSAWEDTDGDGYPNDLYPPSTSVPPLEEDTDDDNDGWSDIEEVNCGSDPLNATDMPVDENGDGICDVLDLDWDDDGIPNANETDTGIYNDPSDTGTDPWNPDTDGDGFCDGPLAVSNGTVMICTAGPDPFPHDPTMPLDTDGDGDPDSLPVDYIGNLIEDLDDDNDGHSDAEEDLCGSDSLDNMSMPTDLDGDTICDGQDPDVDGDGLSNEVESATDSLTNSSNADSDGDGICDGPSAPALPAGICAAGPDAFPDDPAAWLDTDGDGDPDDIVDGVTTDLVLDTDDDNDQWSDEDEAACGTDSKDDMSTPFDGDDDGICDVLDTQTLNYTIYNGTDWIEANVFETYVNQSDFMLKPNLTGMEQGTWSISPALPAGLEFSGTQIARSGETGYITGVPTESSPMTNYTVTADNGRVSKSFTFQLAVLNDTDGDSLPDEPSVTGLETDLDDDNDGHLDAIELKCGSDPTNQTSVPDVDMDGNCIEGKYSDEADDDSSGVFLWCLPLIILLLVLLFLIPLLIRDRAVLLGPEPENTTSEPDFLSGAGTKDDPFVLKPIKALKAGTMAEAKETISIINMSPEIRVNLLDLAEATNEKRFRMYEIDGSTEEPGFNLDADEEGRLRLRFVFDDSDVPTYPGGTYEGLLKLGKASVYLSWTVEVKEDKRKMNKIRKEREAAEKAEKEAKEAEEKAKAEAEAKEAEEKAKAEAEAKAAEEKAAKEAEKKAKAEEKAAKKPATTKEAKKEEELQRVKERAKTIDFKVIGEATSTKLKGKVKKGADSLELADASAFAESGSAEVTDADGSTIIAWTGKDGNVLTGVTGISRAFAASSIVLVKDDLQAIKGVGPFLEEKLNALGITTYQQVANMNDKLEEQVNEAIEFFPGRVKRDQWVAQAKVLLGMEAELNKKALKEAEEQAKAEAEAKAAEEKAAKEAEEKAKAEAEAKAAKEAEEKAKAEAEAKAAKEAEEKAAAAAAAKKAKEEEEAKKKAEAEAKAAEEKAAKEAEEKAKAEAAAKKKAEKKPAATKEAKKQEELQRVKQRAKTIDFKVIGEASSSELKSEVKKGATTLEVANAKDFAESGSAEINDAKGTNVIAWTGKDGNTLTGVSGVTRVFAAKAVLMVKDDLQVIKGIGPFIEEKLNALGITTYRQLANMTAKLETQVNEAIEFFPGRVKRDQWVAQAKILLGMDAKLDEKALKQAEELERVAQKAEGIDFDVLGVASASEADDLQKIKGIGPFIAEKLNALGIFKFSQLANMTSEIEEEVNVAIEFFPGRVKRDEWAKQAKEFAKD